MVIAEGLAGVTAVRPDIVIAARLAGVAIVRLFRNLREEEE